VEREIEVPQTVPVEIFVMLPVTEETEVTEMVARKVQVKTQIDVPEYVLVPVTNPPCHWQ
jgi:hypothetical protein